MSMVKMPFTENGVTVNFPDHQYWQWQDCKGYRKMSGRQVKEMDFCWWDEQEGTLWLVELKGFHNPANPKHKAPNFWESYSLYEKLEELVAKSIHTLCMVGSPRSPAAVCILPDIPVKTCELQLVHVLHVEDKFQSDVLFINDHLKTRLKPFLALFSMPVTHVRAMPYQMAQEKFDWVL